MKQAANPLDHKRTDKPHIYPLPALPPNPHARQQTPDPRCRGLLIEFSATFGQVAEAEHAFDRYTKSVVFDYAYDRFHADRYGKDFWHLRLDGGGEIGPVAQRQTLTAALVAYWHQLATFRDGASRRRGAVAGLHIAEPLWVLLGLSVIGGSTKSDAEQTSDVVEVLRFLDAILRKPADWTLWLGEVLAIPAGGTDLLPPEVRNVLHGQTAEPLAGRILAEVFDWRAGDKPVLRLLKAALGELGLGVLRGDAARYFGVVNVGDANGLKKAAEQAGLSVTVEAIGDGWLAGINAVTLALGVTATTTTLSRAGVDRAQGLAGNDITAGFRQGLPLLDRDGLWRELVKFKRLRRWWNFRFDRAAIEAALNSNRYRIVGLSAVLEVREEVDLHRLNRVAATLLRRLFENAYRKQESRHCQYALADAVSSGIPAVYYKEFVDGENQNS